MWKDLDWTGSHSAFQSTKQLYLHWGPDTHTCHAGQYIFMYQIGNKSTFENKFIKKKLNNNLPFCDISLSGWLQEVKYYIS